MNAVVARDWRFVAVCMALLWSSDSVAQERKRLIDCDAGATIRAALAQLSVGDTLVVRGVCRENVMMGPDVVGIILDGQGTAVIEHPDSSAPPGPGAHPVYIRGRLITITGFTIRGGEDGVHLSGPAHAVIANNVIIRNRGRGITVDKGSVAQIVGNRISENGGAGINITENSYARIGFLIPPDLQPRPNVIVQNRGAGIVVQFGSSAWIVGNEVAENSGDGVTVDRGGSADVLGNAIDRNGGNGISVSRNSGVVLHSRGSPRGEGANQSSAPASNLGFGVECTLASFVEGPLGTLSGARGSKRIGEGCIDAITPR